MNIINEEIKSDKANSIRFNQDNSMISIGTERGYKIFRTYPLSDKHEKKLFGGISICEMSYRSNYLALIGGGNTPNFSNKKVVIYNDAEDCIESEYKFTTSVINVKYKKNLLFIVLEKKIYVFNTENNQNIDSFDTIENKKGMIAVNGSPNKTIMAHPIQFEDKKDQAYVGIKNYKTNKYFPLPVQEEAISNMTMDYYGLLLATANDKGTIVRIHSIDNRILLYECKRGKEKSLINYMSFDTDYKYFGLTSDRGTLHIWKLNDIVQKNPSRRTYTFNENKKKNDINKNFENDFVSIIETNTEINNKFNNSEDKYKVKQIKDHKTETSFAKIKINIPDCIFCFKADNIVIIVTPDEKYCFSKIEKKGGYLKFFPKDLEKKEE
jgi:WD40 repeat protein